ncbi:MAG TPA: HAD family hydrolase [Syntrophales bacterium]|jgi:phosphoglycolate phosphatase|nr:HAD family hydrolase [Syntrophales bacterium]HPX54901.1 HAD family hydrolase [Syntrophales bacterium]HQA83198.1 HAD family hydrolase [Syntrophales bacterium]
MKRTLLPLSRPPIEAVVFDFDGTLAELHIDFGEMRSAVCRLMEQYDVVPRIFDHLYILEMIEAAGVQIKEHSPEKGATFFDDALRLIEGMEIEAAGKSNLFDGVREMLVTLTKRRISIGIITRNCFRALQVMFPDYRDYVDALITREMTRFVKPDPRHLTEILSMLAAPAERTLMVGDHPIDIQIGKEVGTYTAAVLTGTGKRPDLQKSSPDFLLSRVVEVGRIIELTNHRIPD